MSITKQQGARGPIVRWREGKRACEVEREEDGTWSVCVEERLDGDDRHALIYLPAKDLRAMAEAVLEALDGS